MRGVLITGGARRIGAEVSRWLARNGWHVAIHFNSSGNAAAALANQIREFGGACSLAQGDLTVSHERAAVLDQAFGSGADMEALVNNASAFDYDNFDGATIDSLEQNFRTNAAAPILLTKEFAARLPRTSSGCVVNLLDNKVFALNPDYFSYTVAKFALYGATQMMSMALRPNVRVAGIAPGITLASDGQSDHNFSVARRMNPLKSPCTPDQIARAVEFILTTQTYNGSVLTIDGGETLAPHGRDVAFVEARPT